MTLLRADLDEQKRLLTGLESAELTARAPCHPGAPVRVIYLPGVVEVSCFDCGSPLMDILVDYDRNFPRADVAVELTSDCHPAAGCCVRYRRGVITLSCSDCDAYVRGYSVAEDHDA